MWVVVRAQFSGCKGDCHLVVADWCELIAEESVMQEVELLMETSNWRSREVKYIGGNWGQIKEYIPSFELCDFDEGDGEMVNPYYKKVVRLPLTSLENRISVGLVSNTYTLAQHKEVATLCMEGIKKNCGIDIDSVRCELGLFSPK